MTVKEMVSVRVDRERKILAVKRCIQSEEIELVGLRKILAVSRALQLDSIESRARNGVTITRQA